MTGGRRAKKREFSKTIISTVGAVTIVVTAFTLVMVWRTGRHVAPCLSDPRCLR